MSNHPTRRSFLKTAAALAGSTAAAAIVPRHVLGGPRNIPPSEKMNVAGVGIGGMGGGNLAALEAENIVALCDVHPNHAAGTIHPPRGRVAVADGRCPSRSGTSQSTGRVSS